MNTYTTVESVFIGLTLSSPSAAYGLEVPPYFHGIAPLPSLTYNLKVTLPLDTIVKSQNNKKLNHAGVFKKKVRLNFFNFSQLAPKRL